MENRIDISVEFSYQGERHAPSATLDLDVLMEKGAELVDLHALLAGQHGIDTYSYLYEVMEAHELVFSQATGLARHCLHEGQFDLDRFRHLWRQQREMRILDDIAARHLNIADLSKHPQLQAALLAAYEAGKKAE